MSFDDSYHLPFLVGTSSDGVLAKSLPPNFRRNIYILAIGVHDHGIVIEVLEACISSQVPSVIAYVDLWIVKRNNRPHTDLEEQRMMFNQVRFAPINLDPIPDSVACRAVTSLHKPECPEHVVQMVWSPFWLDFKLAHFENYDEMYETVTWSYPVAKTLLPSGAVILPIRSTYAVKYTETDSLWELQFRSCDNGARMIEDIHYDQPFTPIAMSDIICIIISLGSAQGKQAYILEICNAFQNTTEFYPSKRTYSTFPPFFVEYLRLSWDTHPSLHDVEHDPSAYVIQKKISLQGQKDAGQKFYQLMHKYMKHIGLHRSIYDHGVFVWKQQSSEFFLVLATDDCLVLCDDWSQFLDLKAFEVTLQEGAILHFLNLRIIQSPAGISIDQTDHIVEKIVTPYFKNQDTSTLVSITSPFQMDSSFEQSLYEALVLVVAALKKLEDQHGGSIYHWNGVLLHVAITTIVDINYAIMRISGYLAAPSDVIFEGLAHTMRYLFFFQHIPILYPRRPLKKSIWCYTL
jgi:hypothetical protein